MERYSLRVLSTALQDIQDATDWYNSASPGLGTRFQKQILQQIDSLRYSPLIYRIRYATVRCIVIRKFPFMVHFVLNEEKGTATIFAVFHTSRNPKIWNKRRTKVGL